MVDELFSCRRCGRELDGEEEAISKKCLLCASLERGFDEKTKEELNTDSKFSLQVRESLR